VGDRNGAANSHNYLGWLYRQMGQFDQSIFHHQEYLRMWNDMGSQVRVNDGFLLLGIALARLACEISGVNRQEYFRQALVLFGAASGLSHQYRPFIARPDEVEYQSAYDTLKRELGETEFQATFEKGQVMTFEQAVAYALEELG
jgi:hypothetical protein